MRALTVTIIGIAAISILIDVLLPEGKTSKYIKGIYSVLTMVIILSNVVNIYKGGIDFGNFFDEPSQSYEQNDETAIKIIKSRFDDRVKTCIKILSDKGVNNVTIEYEIADEKPYGLTSVRVDVGKDYGMREEELKNTVSTVMIVKKEAIAIYVKRE